jgi:hypothetical protein
VARRQSYDREQGCQIFLGATYQKREKIAKRPTHLPTGHKKYQHLPLQDPPKCTEIGFFVLEIYHLATLIVSYNASAVKILQCNV